MTGRFTDIPKRLRDVAQLDHEQINYGGWLAISDLMESAALKIEALERTAKRAERELLWAGDQFEGGTVLKAAADECRNAISFQGK